MTIDRDLDTARVVRSWLRTDEHESADRVLDSVLAMLDTTPQRRSWWPARRFADMNSFAKLAIAAAAVVVVAVVGINLLPRSGGDVGGLPPSPSPSVSLSPSPSIPPEPTPIADGFPAAGGIPAGRTTFTQDGVRFSLDIQADDWTTQGIEVPPDGMTMSKGRRGATANAWILLWSIDGVFSDPCAQVAAPPAGPSRADLAAAVVGMSDIQMVTGPTETTLGGRPTTYLSLRVPENADCTAAQFFLWYDDVNCGGQYPCHRWATIYGETHYIWIIDANGTRIWIEAETYPDSPPALVEEVRSIIESIEFE